MIMFSMCNVVCVCVLFAMDSNQIYMKICKRDGANMDIYGKSVSHKQLPLQIAHFQKKKIPFSSFQKGKYFALDLPELPNGFFPSNVAKGT